ncbi:MAG: hypothetical protein JNG84_10090 [Archangium sp.]|nr:hypothetical protein [Archangium sp.]
MIARPVSDIELRSHHTKPRKGLRRALWVLAVVGLVVVAALIAAQPVAHWAVRRGMDSVPGYRSTYDIASVGFFPLNAHLTKLHMVPSDRSLPLLDVEDARLGLHVKALLQRQVRPWASVDKAKVVIFAPSIPTPAQLVLLRQAKTVAKALATDTDQKLKEIPVPLLLDSVQLRNSELLVVFAKERSDDPSDPGGKAPELWLHDIEASFDGLATRDGLSPIPARVVFKGRLAKSGTVTAFLTADLLAPGGLTFAGQAAVKGQELADLHDLLHVAGLKATGTVDLEVRVGVKENVITGAVQPMIKNANFEAATPQALDALKAVLLDGAVGLTSDRVPERNAVATVVPFSGKLTEPSVNVWEAIAATFRNAFVLGLVETLSSSPEARAAK